MYMYMYALQCKCVYRHCTCILNSVHAHSQAQTHKHTQTNKQTNTHTISETPRQNADNSFFIVNREFDNFSKKWFETEIEFASTAVGDVAADDSSNDSSPRHSLASSFKTGHPYYMGYEYSEDTYGES